MWDLQGTSACGRGLFVFLPRHPTPTLLYLPRLMGSSFFVCGCLNSVFIFKFFLMFEHNIPYEVLFSHSVISNSLQPHGLQHARLPCPSLSPRVCSNSCPWIPYDYAGSVLNPLILTASYEVEKFKEWYKELLYTM